MDKQIYPEPVVGAIIFNEKNEVLLLKSYKANNNYIIPGGHIEVGEPFEQALRREVKEETNLEIKDIKLVGLQEFINDQEAYFVIRHFVFIDYVCRADSTEVKLNDEHQAYIWSNINDALLLSLDKYTRQLLKNIKDNAAGMNSIYYNYFKK
jgi:nucleoside triphosphatase